MDSDRYIAVVIQSPFEPRIHISFAIDENVVKPPQKPIINGTFAAGENICVRSRSPNINPAIKHPKMLTKNVPSGNCPWYESAHHLTTR